jgi:hypothetical protein
VCERHTGGRLYVAAGLLEWQYHDRALGDPFVRLGYGVEDWRATAVSSTIACPNGDQVCIAERNFERGVSRSVLSVGAGLWWSFKGQALSLSVEDLIGKYAAPGQESILQQDLLISLKLHFGPAAGR